MSIRILTANENPKVEKLKKEFDIFRVIDIKKGELQMIEFFNKDGAFRGFGRDTKTAFKKAKKVLKNYYS
ncbi:hypothetical protein CRV03_04915 [Arcobacter sp. F155]|mgnify:CR=1 FL=1|uniref:hypothetical protein n=1 Tax=Arcobacteraceae TaxID=2808963 RepID=UPI00100B7F66|nr:MULTISPECIES: hypothetical protein [unclassified Arcobacter]RXJ77576.1 hypothetical protein CRV03_04915 [Arcobacter sp. F155]RXK01756.1 hypothetical protein CRV02_07705 [Arcobacter sp. CECT 8989]